MSVIFIKQIKPKGYRSQGRLTWYGTGLLLYIKQTSCIRKDSWVQIERRREIAQLCEHAKKLLKTIFGTLKIKDFQVDSQAAKFE